MKLNAQMHQHGHSKTANRFQLYMPHINVQMNPNGMSITNALPAQMLQDSLNTDEQIGEHTLLYHFTKLSYMQ
jgi:hypothetical protein